MRRPTSLVTVATTAVLVLTLSACGGEEVAPRDQGADGPAAAGDDAEEPASFDGEPNDIVQESPFGEPIVTDGGLEVVIDAPQPHTTTETGPDGAEPYSFAVTITNVGDEPYVTSWPGTTVNSGGRSARFIDYPSDVNFEELAPGETYEGSITAWITETDDVSASIGLGYLSSSLVFATPNQLTNTGVPSGPQLSEEEDVTIAFGETHTYSDGISITASEPTPYTSPTVTTEPGVEGTIYEVTVTVTNDSGNRLKFYGDGEFTIAGEDTTLWDFANDWKKGKHGSTFTIDDVPNGGSWTGGVLLVLTDPSQLTYTIDPLSNRGAVVFTS